ncbi:MAG: hypothetical protein HYW23_02305 [Candidatus Aenigmarchaeota archaeon]|nr:hypothetical protein [Candidatus Aenigmarchaeota archaeon]
MEEEIRTSAGKEVDRIKKIMDGLKVVDSKKTDSLVRVMKSYYDDCVSFYRKEKYLQCLETAFIVWAYVDAGLHLGVFKVPGDLKKMFTI